MQDHQISQPICTVDPYEYLKIVLNPDGSITRLWDVPSTAIAPDDDDLSPVLYKDVPLNPSKETSLRIYLPRQALDCTTSSTKLPLILFIHGGGFVLFSASTTVCHDFCYQMVAHLQALVVSVDYRLAPEHRLPAAYDDAIDAIHWIRCTKDQWLLDFADFSDIYLMGGSAGGNIAYHAGLRISTAAINGNLEPLKIQGLILHHPFFGGSKRTASQLRLINDPVLPLSGTDLMWELGLPLGVDRDHEFCNPTLENGSHSDQLENIKSLRWRVMMVGCGGDPLIDHQKELVKMLEKKGVHVSAIFSEGDHHGAEIYDLLKAEALFVAIEEFIQH